MRSAVQNSCEVQNKEQQPRARPPVRGGVYGVVGERTDDRSEDLCQKMRDAKKAKRDEAQKDKWREAATELADHVESNPASLHSAAAQEAVQKAKSLRQKKKQDSADRREVSVSR